MSTSIYLDHNATAPVFPEVAEAVREASLRYQGNPSSQHAAGRLARKALEDAREQIGARLGAHMGGQHADRVLFTSGGTEANNLALMGLWGAAPTGPTGPPAGHLITTPIEHVSVTEAAAWLARHGTQVDYLPVDSQGRVTADALEELLQGHTRLVSVVMANSETGVVQPIRELVAARGDHPARFHTDAVQAVGKIPVSFRHLGVDALTCTAHKFHGPLGVGVLVLRADVEVTGLLVGGSQQQGLRPGTEMVALAVGMLTALDMVQQQSESARQRVAALRDRLQQRIVSECPEAVVIGGDADRLPNTLNVAFPGIDRQALLMALDLEGIACSAGSACASGSSELSPTHRAMGLSQVVARGAIRLSLGIGSEAVQIDHAAERILKSCKHLRHQ
jgi:cysteine desulfurase